MIEAGQTREILNVQHELVGESAPMIELARFIAKAAPANSTVLIEGESGTGKELVARSLHRNSNRSNGPFVAINCAALPESLLESELFGYEKGAFTGAAAEKKGRFELAIGGTLFLDEVGELASGIQAKLLRVLQERTIDRIAGARPIPVDIRLVAATNRDLHSAVAAGEFRQDLYYRLKVLSVKTPPLRERPEDIPALARHFLLKLAGETGRAVRGISQEVLTILQNYDWPGNVRELQNVIEHAIVVGSTEMVLLTDLPQEFIESAGRCSEGVVYGYRDLVNAFKRHLLETALQRADGDYKEAAALLGLHPRGIHRFLKQLKLTYLLEK